MTFSPKAIEAAAEAMKLGVCQYCRQPAVGAGGGVVDCNCPYRVWDEPTDKERAQIALTAALAVDGVALQGWQPIESAPRGKGLIDVWTVGWGVEPHRVADCYYDSICDEWRTSRPAGQLICIKARYVTHWMALPASPTGNEGKPSPTPEGL